MNLKRILIGAVFGTWFTVTAFSQHPDDKYSRARDLLRGAGGMAVPNWKFFAPNPGVEDTVLMYRTGCPDDHEWGAWSRVSDPPGKDILSSFYSPSSRKAKGILDIFMSLGTGQQDPDAWEAHDAGMRLIRAATVGQLASVPDSHTHFQTMLLHSAGYETKIPPRYQVIFPPEPIGPLSTQI
ncbi:MAG: hypothetical protein Q4C81_09285 [Kocuria sp.]|nr:hypothetical protein [Kocuria sp.]